MADHLTARAFHHTEVSDEPAPSWWILADQDGNEACVANRHRRPGLPGLTRAVVIISSLLGCGRQS